MKLLATRLAFHGRKQPFKLLLALWFSVTTYCNANPGPFYDYQIVIQTGQLGLTGIKSKLSINDAGDVAFIGNLPNGDGVFVWNRSTEGFQCLNEDSVNANRLYTSLWINNNNGQVATALRVPGIPHVAYVRRYSKTSMAGAYEQETVAKANTALRTTQYNPCAPFADCFFTVTSRIEPFDDILQDLSMNDSGMIAFTGMLGTTYYLTEQTAYANSIGSSFTTNSLPHWEPIIDSLGRVLVREGTQPNSPIQLFSATLGGQPETIANSSTFSQLGQNPGMISDGSIVTFYARKASGEFGIYASTKVSGGWEETKIAGGNDGLTSFSSDTHIGIARSDCGINIATVVYIGAKGTQLGIFSTHLVNAPPKGDATFSFSSPTKVVQVGDSLDGLAGVVQNLGIYSPVNSAGDVAFWVQTTDQNGTTHEAVVVARPKGFRQAGYSFGDSGRVPKYYGERVNGRATHLTQKSGCVLSSVATMLTSFPELESFTPVNLDQRLADRTDRNLWHGGDFTKAWGYLTALSGFRVKMIDKGPARNDAVPRQNIDPMAYLEEHVCQRGERVILWLHEEIGADLTTDPYHKLLPLSDHDHHAIFVLGKNGDDWRVFDPGWSNAYRPGSQSIQPELLRSQTNRLNLTGNVLFHNLTVSNGATLSVAGLVNSGSLTIGSGGMLTEPSLSVLDVTVGGTLTVASNGVVDISGKGYAGGVGDSQPAQGPGQGDAYPLGGAGSYGGIGARNSNGPVRVYGSYFAPMDFGSGGGDFFPGGWSNPGGSGGGRLWISAGQLRVDGVITADGAAGNGPYIGGGGSGGSVYIIASSLTGSGTIRANGGDTGGGGGRVALYYADRTGFAGTFEAQGASGGGAGTVYLKQSSDAYGELLVDNGGIQTSGWSTPLPGLGILHLDSLLISGGARVSTSGGLRVGSGDPAQFIGLISSNYLQVGSLIVSNTWVFGPVIDLSISQSNGTVVVSALCEPLRTYLLLASTNLSSWIPISTNAPAGSSFSFLDTQSPLFARRFFRGVLLDFPFNALSISVNPTNNQALLTIEAAQPNHTFVVQASVDLIQWIPVLTNSPVSVTNLQFLDTNAPGFSKRFYRVSSQ